MPLRHIPPPRAKKIAYMFYGTGALGIYMGLTFADGFASIMITFLAVINVGLGAFFTYILLTQAPKKPDKRKKRRDI